MIHAYDESYRPQLRNRLGKVFDLAVNMEGYDIDEFSRVFAASEVARGIEAAFPKYLAGMSGQEMLSEILGKRIVSPELSLDRSPEYWVGHTMAYVQWEYNRPFGRIFDAYPCSKLLLRYPVLHEADITRASEIIGKVLIPENIVRRRRKLMGLTQKQLADRCGISISTISAYEHDTLLLENASGITLYTLAKRLGISMEELLLG